MPRVPSPDTDPIGYLCARRFPMAIEHPIYPSLHRSNSPDSIQANREYNRRIEEAEEKSKVYRAELSALDRGEVLRLVAEEKLKEQSQRKMKEDREEDARSINIRLTAVEIEHYAKLRYWTIDEGVALAFGRSPEHAKWEYVKAYKNISVFAKTFEKAKQIADRAVGIKELGQTNLPGFFLAWAKRMNLPVPLALENEVAKYGPIVDWRGHCETLNAQVSKLTERIKELESAQNAIPAVIPPWGKHDTALLQHLAAAAEKFWKNYDPSDNTTAPTNAQIIDWLVERHVTKRTAEVMATILRADGLPTGPRK